MAKIIGAITVTKDDPGFGSCRFCSEGEGKHRVFDDVSTEVFYLCGRHKQEYKEAPDDIQTNIDIRAAIVAKGV